MNNRTRNIIMVIIFMGIVFAGWSYTTVNSARFWDDQGNTFPPAFGNINFKGINGLEIDSYQISDAGCEVIFGINPANIPSLADEKVKVSSNETAAGYLFEQLAVSARNEITFTETGDGGDETVTFNFNANYSDITANDGDTDVLATEFEELSDGSETSLHSHGSSSALRDSNYLTKGAEVVDQSVASFAPAFLEIDGILTSSSQGIHPVRAGSITGIAINCTSVIETVPTIDEIRYEVYLNGTQIGLFVDVDDGGFLVSNTQAIGVDAFVADDILTIGAYYQDNGGVKTTLTALGAIGTVEVYYD